MLFRKKIQRSCSYCRHGVSFDKDQILCTKYGIVSALYSCRKFKYDPCKRVPSKAKAPDFERYKNEDFSL